MISYHTVVYEGVTCLGKFGGASCQPRRSTTHSSSETHEARRTSPIADKWIRPFASVGDQEPLHEALEILQRRGSHLARVLGGDGTTLGLITMEDVIEELVGEIRDAAHLEGSASPPD